MYKSIMGISIEVDTYGFKWYWQCRWRNLLISLRLRKRPEPDPIASMWSAETAIAFREAQMFSKMVDRAFETELRAGDSVSISGAGYVATKQGDD